MGGDADSDWSYAMRKSRDSGYPGDLLGDGRRGDGAELCLRLWSVQGGAEGPESKAGFDIKHGVLTHMDHSLDVWLDEHPGTLPENVIVARDGLALDWPLR